MKKEELEALLQDMTLEEKVGQMIQIRANMLTEGGIVTGPMNHVSLSEKELAQGCTFSPELLEEASAVSARKRFSKNHISS